MVDFRFFLNKQGPKGAKGDQGEQGFSPEITVDTDTAAEYKLRITTASDSFVTENLRGSAVDDQGGTYMRYNPDTQGMYAGDADIADTTTYGVVKTASDEDISTGASDKVVSAEQLKEAIDEVTSTSTTTYATKEELATESSTRESTDTSLDNRLTAVEGSIPDVSGFATKTSLSTEISNRTAADEILAGFISTETTDRTNADTSLATSISTLASQIPDISNLATKAELSTETSTRTAMDTTLQESISTLASQIPTVNDGTLTIKQNGTTLTTFSANQSSDAEVDIIDSGVAANNGKLTIQQDGVTVGEFTADQSSDTTLNITTPTVNDTTITFNYGTTSVGSITLNQAVTETITIPEATSSTPITTTLTSQSTNDEVPGAKCVYDELQEIPEYTFSTGLTEAPSLTEIDVTPRTTGTPTGNYTTGTTVITSEYGSVNSNYLRYAFDNDTSTQFVQQYPNPNISIQDSQGYDFDIVKIRPGAGSGGTNFASFTLSYWALPTGWIDIATTTTLVDGWATISGIGDTIRSLAANTKLRFHIDMVNTSQWGGYREIQLYKLQGSDRERIVSANMATSSSPGIIKPDNETVKVTSKSYASSYQATQFGQYLQTASAIPFNTADSWQIDLDILYKQEYNTTNPNHCIFGTSSGTITDVFNFFKEAAGLKWYITSGTSANDIGTIEGIDPVDNTRYIFRLQYKNSVYSAYYSTDGGSTFTQMGSSITSSTKVASSVPLRFFESGWNADRYATKGTIFCEKTKIYINDEVYLDFMDAQANSLLTNSGCTKVDTDPMAVLSVIDDGESLNFADKGLSNLTNTGKIAIAHNAMPSSTYIDLTVGASGTTYTAPEDGYFAAVSNVGTGESWFVLHNSITGLGSYCQCPVGFDLQKVFIPASKGDVITFDYGGVTVKFLHFIYANGSESEAS